MQKVMIIGCPGGGKSTFARALHKSTGLPLFHLDMLHWNPDRTTVPRPVFLDRQRAVLEQPAWIIDGNYGSTIEWRLQHCDTVFFLDYPLDICLEGVSARKGKPRTDMPWVEPQEDDEAFLGFIRSFETESRPVILDLLRAYAEREIIVFHSRREADMFLESLQ